MKIIFIFTISLLLVSCASRPILDDNAKYRSVGDAQAEKDVDACMAKADAYLDKYEARRTGKAAARGATGGAIIGGLFGALTGDIDGVVSGAASGAVVGGVSGATGHKISPDTIKQRYTAKCLREKGYQVLGFD